MEGSSIDIIVFAPLAPILGVLLFWFIQLLFIESEKYFLLKIRPKHEPLCRFTNFLGILFQTICHALGYTVTKSGISDFYISVNYGRVAPKKEKKGIFEWISNAFLFIGPFFLPAFILLICLFFGGVNFEIVTPSQVLDIKYTFGGQISTFGASLHSFANGFFGFLYNIDLLHPGHFGFLLLFIFFGMGIRPSYISEKKQEKVDMLYDLKNIYSLILKKPLYLIILFFPAYLFFYISVFFDQNWYVALFSILGWLSIISIIALFITDMILLLIKTTDEIPRFWKSIPYIIIPVSYILARLLFFYFPIEYSNNIALLIMILSTALITYILLKYKTNKFKTGLDIKRTEGKGKGEKNEK